MKSGRTLEALATELKRRSEAKEDMTAPTSLIRASAVDTSLDPKQAKLSIWLGDTPYGVTKHAHDQIADYLKIPVAYYKRMLDEAPHLLARNINEWIAKKNEHRLVRCLFGDVRALLSPGYRIMENWDLAEVVLKAIADLKLDVMSCELTDRRLYIKAVDPKVTREIKRLGGEWGDGKHIIARGIACPSITVSNSEVGEGRLSVLGGIYQDWCTNLASFGERSMKKTHLGKRHELVDDEIFQLFSDATKKKTDEALWLQVRDTVKLIFDEVRFGELCDKVEGAQAEPIEGDPVKVVKLAAKKFGADDGQEKSVLKHLIEGGSLSRFGLYNAFTRMAQDVEDYDEATRFESVGGKIIELPKKEWQTLAMAA